MPITHNPVFHAVVPSFYDDDDHKLTDMSMLQGLAERMGVDLLSLTPAAFADLYEEYVHLFDEYAVKVQAVADVWNAYKAHRKDRPQAAINGAIQVGFAHGLTLNDIHAILGVSWQDFIAGFFKSSKRSRLEDDLTQDKWAILELGIHMLAERNLLTYSEVRKLVRSLGSDCLGHAVPRLVERFGYELQK